MNFFAENFKSSFKEYVYPKIKFALASVVSTAIDYLVFFSLLYSVPVAVAIIQAIAQLSGMLTNFILQRNYIFSKERSLKASFIWSLSFSALALILTSTLVHFLYQISFFNEHPILMKIGVTVLFFFFNFYSKQYAFENQLKW